jgi:hypothetical protein
MWLAGVVSVLLPVMLATPAIAAACPHWSNVKAFRGDADTAFDGTATGSDNNGGTVTVGLDRAGSVKIDLGGRIPKSGSAMTEFLGGTGGGILRVDDTYADTGGGTSTTGRQTADGPGVRDGFSNLAFLVLSPSSCTYQLHISFGVVTTSTGDWPSPPDPGAGGVAITPVRHIPSNLKLFGTVDVPAYYEGCAGSAPHGGCYEFSGLRGGYAWAQEFDMLKTCGSVVASSCAPEGQEGTATVSWSISPSTPPKKKHKKHT